MSRHVKVAAGRQPIKGQGKIPLGSTEADERALERLRAEIQKGIDSPDDPDFSFDRLRATLDAEDYKRKQKRSADRTRSRA